MKDYVEKLETIQEELLRKVRNIDDLGPIKSVAGTVINPDGIELAQARKIIENVKAFRKIHRRFKEDTTKIVLERHFAEHAFRQADILPVAPDDKGHATVRVPQKTYRMIEGLKEKISWGVSVGVLSTLVFFISFIIFWVNWDLGQIMAICWIGLVLLTILFFFLWLPFRIKISAKRMLARRKKETHFAQERFLFEDLFEAHKDENAKGLRVKVSFEDLSEDYKTAVLTEMQSMELSLSTAMNDKEKVETVILLQRHFALLYLDSDPSEVAQARLQIKSGSHTVFGFGVRTKHAYILDRTSANFLEVGEHDLPSEEELKDVLLFT